MLNRIRYGTAVLAVLGATSITMAANNQPAPANNAPQNQTQQQSSGQSGTQALNLNSDQIRQVQQKLDQSGFKAGQADGVLGRETENALRDFQKQKGLQQTGRPDNETLSALGMNGSAMQNVGQQSSTPNKSAQGTTPPPGATAQSNQSPAKK
jgi:peptidoglycan hydrolase-like protein with peptidoglycan-binding domain